LRSYGIGITEISFSQLVNYIKAIYEIEKEDWQMLASCIRAGFARKQDFQRFLNALK